MEENISVHKIGRGNKTIYEVVSEKTKTSKKKYTHYVYWNETNKMKACLYGVSLANPVTSVKLQRDRGSTVPQGTVLLAFSGYKSEENKKKPLTALCEENRDREVEWER